MITLALYVNRDGSLLGSYGDGPNPIPGNVVITHTPGEGAYQITFGQYFNVLVPVVTVKHVLNDGYDVYAGEPTDQVILTTLDQRGVFVKTYSGNGDYVERCFTLIAIGN